MSTPLFLHIDLDAFFASVEQLDCPSLRGKPVIVGGLHKRGVVSTCSYEARKFGVHSAMPSMQAKKLCPNGIFLPCRMKRYAEKSKEIMNLLKTFSPVFQQISIDEAFLDMSGMERLMGTPADIANTIKKTVYGKTGLTVSAGAASNKYIAKIASGLSKPDGLFIVDIGKEQDFMQSLSLKNVWGIGSRTREKLEHAGLNSIPKITAARLELLHNILGNAAGSFLYNAVRGNVPELFNEEAKSHSISTEKTFQNDIREQEQINTVLFQMASEIMYRMLDKKIQGKTVHVKIRYADFRTVSIQQSGVYINDSKDLYERAKKIFYQKFDKGSSIRLLGLGVMNVESENANLQHELFVSEKTLKMRKMEETVLQINKKDKTSLVQRASFIRYGGEKIS